VFARCARVLLVVGTASLATGCSTLLSADPTPVPGAAATLTRSSRTPIPTPDRPAASPGASPVPSRVASPGPSPVASRQVVTEEEIAQLQRRMDATVNDPRLPGLESLLLDHVSLSTSQGGSVLDNTQAAGWLRDRAGAGIKVTRLERGTQTLMLQVVSEGWPNADPIEQGRVSFSLRRYDPNGRPDEENGDWKVDVIEAE
jgi:hypothetical protein